MRTFKFLLFGAVVGLGLAMTAPAAKAQVGVTIGPEPVCPYGYYYNDPYDCAPYGYYGPEWFDGGGVFIGGGPWFHGRPEFRGYVDNRFHPEHGYRGPYPRRGERAERHIDGGHFRGNEMRDGRGHVMREKR
jgi:hypothetical protein